MNGQETTAPAGQHYSGRNRVPNIHEFVQQLDRDKKERDAAIDEQLKLNKQNEAPGGESQPHQNPPPKNKDHRRVRDPVTGADVEIQDADVDFAEAVDNPQVSHVEVLPDKPVIGVDAISVADHPQRKPWQKSDNCDLIQAIWGRIPTRSRCHCSA